MTRSAAADWSRAEQRQAEGPPAAQVCSQTPEGTPGSQQTKPSSGPRDKALSRMTHCLH